MAATTNQPEPAKINDFSSVIFESMHFSFFVLLSFKFSDAVMFGQNTINIQVVPVIWHFWWLMLITDSVITRMTSTLSILWKIKQNLTFAFLRPSCLLISTNFDLAKKCFYLFKSKSNLNEGGTDPGVHSLFPQVISFLQTDTGGWTESSKGGVSELQLLEDCLVTQLCGKTGRFLRNSASKRPAIRAIAFCEAAFSFVYPRPHRTHLTSCDLFCSWALLCQWWLKPVTVNWWIVTLRWDADPFSVDREKM